MSRVTLEMVDKALANSTDESPDNRALLWITRAHLLGQPIGPEHLPYLMGISEEEAGDIFARLSEAGLIELDE